MFGPPPQSLFQSRWRFNRLFEFHFSKCSFWPRFCSIFLGAVSLLAPSTNFFPKYLRSWWTCLMHWRCRVDVVWLILLSSVPCHWTYYKSAFFDAAQAYFPLHARPGIGATYLCSLEEPVACRSARILCGGRRGTGLHQWIDSYPVAQRVWWRKFHLHYLNWTIQHYGQSLTVASSLQKDMFRR